MNQTKHESPGILDAEHTATPWRAYEANPNSIDVTAPDGTLIATVARWTHGLPGNASENQANAAFIVRAVNAHDALVAALKAELVQIKFMQTLPAITKVVGESLNSNVRRIEGALKFTE